MSVKTGEQPLFLKFSPFLGRNLKTIKSQQLSEGFQKVCIQTGQYISRHRWEIITLALVVFIIYGQELFSLHLTVDEENAANSFGPSDSFLPSGRWGLFLFTKIFLSRPIIPFIPTALTFIFFVVSAAILLHLLGIQNAKEQTLLLSLFIGWSGLSYMVSFSTNNWLISFGFLCIAFCFLLLNNPKKPIRYASLIPISLIFSLYEPLLVPLLLTWFLLMLYRSDVGWKTAIKFSRDFLISLILGYLVFLGVQKLFYAIYQIEPSFYSSHYFGSSAKNIGWYITKVLHLAYNVYAGDSTFYGLSAHAFPLFLLIAGLIILVGEYKHRKTAISFAIFLFLLLLFSLLPFIGGILTKGYIPYRSLLGVPVFLMGWAALALKYARPTAKLALGILALGTLFQFATSANHLFASSAFAYEEDKLLAYQLINRIEEEKARTSSPQPQYLEMIGFVERPSTPLVSRIENIGASFFGWDGGHSKRVVNFLKILGYTSLEALAEDRRSAYVKYGAAMPVWPEYGSVKVLGDVVLVKFSEYSNQQIKTLCASKNASQLPDSFCPIP